METGRNPVSISLLVKYISGVQWPLFFRAVLPKKLHFKKEIEELNQDIAGKIRRWLISFPGKVPLEVPLVLSFSHQPPGISSCFLLYFLFSLQGSLFVGPSFPTSCISPSPSPESSHSPFLKRSNLVLPQLLFLYRHPSTPKLNTVFGTSILEIIMTKKEYWEFLLSLLLYACVLSFFSHVRLCATLGTVARQAPLFMGSSKQRILRVGCYALLQGIFLTQGLNPCLLHLLHYRQILYCWATREAHPSY